MPGLPLRESWLWLFGSLGLAALAANIAWPIRRLRPGAMRDAVERLTAHPATPYLWQVIRALYYVGLPFAALLWGRDAVVGRWLGLQPFALFGADVGAVGGWLDWARDVGWVAALGGATGVFLAVVGLTYRRAVADGLQQQPPTAPALREAIYHEVHWAFYRNGPILALGPYGGTWVGLLLVAVEAWLNPAWRAGLRDVNQAPTQLLRAAMAVLSTLAFLQTQNLWLAILLHWTITARLGSLFAGRVKND